LYSFIETPTFEAATMENQTSPRLTVIVSYYKALDNLKVILEAFHRQSSTEFEIIVSEDDFNEETISFLKAETSRRSFPIHHLHQDKDVGFRKNMMLNKSLRLCRTDFVAFIDGDCIPHRHFVREYISHLKEGIFLGGRAVMLGQKISATLLKDHSIDKLMLSLLFSDSKKVKEGLYFPLFPLAHKVRGLSGRNWGVMIKYLFEVNGFDEDYQNAGVGEDVDIEWRLLAHGLRRESIKNKAIVYHLYHPRSYGQEGVQLNYAKLKNKQVSNQVRCLRGIETLI
jgi:glycosyltransferase involved in cell wall biosynthesis